MIDPGFWLLIAGGVALLALGALRRRSVADSRAHRFGMRPLDDLTQLPSELGRTALWSLCDGGFERSPVGGRLSLHAHDVDVSVFGLESLRARRGEWAYLELEPPFRLSSPLLVVACRLPRQLPHVLIKRSGPGDDIGDRPFEGMSSLPAAVRTNLHMGRSVPADPVPALGREPVARMTPMATEGEWRVWSAAADEARALVGSDAGWLDRLGGELLLGEELVIELLGPLVLVYPASAGELEEPRAEALLAAATAVCERLLASTPTLGPRGVDG